MVKWGLTGEAEEKLCPFQFQAFCLLFHLLSSPQLWLGFTLASASVGFGGSHSTNRSEAHSDSAVLSPNRWSLNKMFGEIYASFVCFLLLWLLSPWIASETLWTSSLMPALRWNLRCGRLHDWWPSRTVSACECPWGHTVAWLKTFLGPTDCDVEGPLASGGGASRRFLMSPKVTLAAQVASISSVQQAQHAPV